MRNKTKLQRNSVWLELELSLAISNVYIIAKFPNVAII